MHVARKNVQNIQNTVLFITFNRSKLLSRLHLSDYIVKNVTLHKNPRSGYLILGILCSFHNVVGTKIHASDRQSETDCHKQYKLIYNKYERSIKGTSNNPDHSLRTR